MLVCRLDMSIKINHYASKVLDSSGSSSLEVLATKIVMLIMLVGFGYWFLKLGVFWGVVFFGIASIPIGILVLIEILILIKKLVLWLKNKLL